MQWSVSQFVRHQSLNQSIRLVIQQVSEWVSLWVSQSVSQSVCLSVNQSVSLSVSQFSQSVCMSISQSASQSVSQSVSLSVCQSTNDKSVGQLVIMLTSLNVQDTMNIYWSSLQYTASFFSLFLILVPYVTLRNLLAVLEKFQKKPSLKLTWKPTWSRLNLILWM